MNILWIVNIEFPEALKLLTGKGELKSSGGWLLGAAEALVETTDVNLFVATVSTHVTKLTRLQGERVVYYLIPYGKGNKKKNNEYQKYWKIINRDIIPNIVHIYGTEYSHGLAYVDACGADNVVVSVQGLKSAISQFYNYGLTNWDIINNITFRDVIKGSLFSEKKRYKKQSEYEIELLQKVNHIIGRTSWDRARTWSINPNAQYHFCNETLRKEFYDSRKWNIDNCHRHTIFLSQAEYPVKGLHQLLKAIPLVLREYPDVSIRVAGSDITKCNSFKDWMHFTTYGKIIKKLIKSLGLSQNVVFTGNLNAEGMRKEYLACNLFICPSTIENSPNSLAEAQILGVPCLASFVGGIPDMMSNKIDWLFRFEETTLLAKKICDMFAKEKKDLENVDYHIEGRQDEVRNALELLNIYSMLNIL